MGTNLRKLLWSAGLVAGGWAVTQAGGHDAAAIVGVTAGLLGGVGGNLAHEVLNAFDDNVFSAVAKLEIDENHHILIQLRRSYLHSLDTLTARYGAYAPSSEADFLTAMEAYILSASLSNSNLVPDQPSAVEKKVFSILPRVFETALAARGSDVLEYSLNAKISAAAELCDAALDELTELLCVAIPFGFRKMFMAKADGFIDLFVRDAAAALKENPAFATIWTAEEIAAVRAGIADLTVQMHRRFDEAEMANQRRHAETLEAIARDKGVPIEGLRPILFKLGQQSDIPVKDYPAFLSEAVDQLLAQSAERLLPTNMGPEVDKAITDARKKLAELDTEGARSILARAIAEQQQKRLAEQRAEVRLLREKAQIERASFDYPAAIADLRQAVELDPDDLQSWRELGGLELRTGKLSLAASTYDKLLGHAIRLGNAREESVACTEIGDAWMQKGELGRALEYYTRGLLIDERLVDDKSNLLAQIDLGVSLSKIGDVLLQRGDLAGALKHYEQGLAIRQRLAADEGDAQAQRYVSISLDNIGDVLRQRGDLAGALEHYEQGLAIAKRLAADDGDAQAQRDLSVSLDNIGGVLRQRGDLAGALEHYEQGLAIAKRLAVDDGDAQAQRDVSVGLDRIGDVLLRRDDLAGALRHYEEGLAIRQRLAVDDGDAQAQRDLSISQNKIGDVLLQRDDLAGALKHYEEGLAIRQRVAVDDGDTQAQRDLSISQNKIGDVLLRRDDLAGALKHYEEGLAIRQRLAVDDGDAQAQRDVSVSLNRIGDVLLQRGDPAGALERYEQGLAMAHRLATDDNDAQAQRDVLVSLWKLASVKRALAAWQAVLAKLEDMSARGILLPPDQPLIALANEQIARLSGAT